jgi:ATP-dependent Clp protease ATP-binding subunit ClpC
MFERFTERARQVVVLAQDEARALGHNYIGSEHLLLGLLAERDGVAARALLSLDVTAEKVRAEVVRIVGRGDGFTAGQIPFTPRAKKALELSLREVLSLGHDYIDTEHILLGLLRDGQGVAVQVLLQLGADTERTRNEIIRLLSASGPSTGSGRQAFSVRLEDAPPRSVTAGRESTVFFPDDWERSASVSQIQREPTGRRSGREAHLTAAVVAAVGFPLGLLVGWLIWA